MNMFHLELHMVGSCLFTFGFQWYLIRVRHTHSFPCPTPTSSQSTQHALLFFHNTYYYLSCYFLVNFFVICSPPSQTEI